MPRTPMPRTRQRALTSHKPLAFAIGGLMALAVLASTGGASAQAADRPAPATVTMTSSASLAAAAALTREGARILAGTADDRCFQAGQLFRRACKAGDAAACRLMAGLYATGTRLIVRDRDRALELYDQGCARGDTASCQQASALDPRGRRPSLLPTTRTL